MDNRNNKVEHSGSNTKKNKDCEAGSSNFRSLLANFLAKNISRNHHHSDHDHSEQSKITNVVKKHHSSTKIKKKHSKSLNRKSGSGKPNNLQRNIYFGQLSPSSASTLPLQTSVSMRSTKSCRRQSRIRNRRKSTSMKRSPTNIASLSGIVSQKRPRKDHHSCKSRCSINKETLSLLIDEATLSFDDPENFPEELKMKEEIVEEYQHENITSLAKTSYEPEKFLLPKIKSEQHFLDRQINVQKLYRYFLKYMIELYNLKHDSDAFAEWRYKLHENMWDLIAYIIPILCKQVIKLLINEQIIVQTKPDCLIFGDIHGNLNDLFYIHEHFIINKNYINHTIIFLGDYVDRGSKSIEVVIFLIILKLLDPLRFILLRGNHEVEKVNKKYGFKCLIDKIYGNTGKKNKVLHNFIFRSLNDVFKHLPVAAVIRFHNRNNKGIFCCHGGIPNELLNNKNKQPWNIDDLIHLTNQYKPHDLIPRKNTSSQQSALSEILWNDPVSSKFNKNHKNNHKLFYPNTKRGGHCSKYTEEAVQRFFDANNLFLLVRGHQFRITKDKGFHYQFSKKVLTVFSSSNYCGVEENTTGMLIVNEDCVEPLVLRSVEESLPYKDFNHLEMTINPKTKEVIKISL